MYPSSVHPSVVVSGAANLNSPILGMKTKIEFNTPFKSPGNQGGLN